MGLQGQLAMMFVGFIVFKFLTNPPPELTEELKSWQSTGKYFNFKEYQIFYIDKEGSGSVGTIVCLHGFPTFSYDWIQVMEGLQKKFNRVILLDFLGYGLSDKPTQHDYSIFEQADVVEELLRSLAIEQVHVMSHDYGDTVAQELVARYNKKQEDSLIIRSLCMLNGGVFTETNHPRPLQRLLLYPWIGPMLSGLTVFPVFKYGLGDVFGPQTTPSSDEIWQFWVGLRYNRGDRVSYRLLQYIPERQANKARWEGAIQNTEVPIHMIYGPSDPVNPPEFIEHYRRVMPDPNLTVLPEAIGHYPQWEAPELVIQSYSNFIDSL